MDNSLSAYKDMPDLKQRTLNNCRSHATAIVVINCDDLSVHLALCTSGHARAKLACFE